MPKTKQWKNGGEEDKYIGKLISQGKINRYTKASFLKQKNASMFSQFSPNVIRNHLNLLKRHHGLYLNGESEDEFHAETAMCVEAANASATPEDINDDDPSSNPCSNIHQNYPILVDTYKDPESQLQKVLVALSLPGGPQNVKTELNDDGTMLIIKYAWPKPLFNMEDLFKKQLASKAINLYHPKVLCVQNGLENVRKRIDAAPESVIKVNLPINVQTSSASWPKSGIKRDDGTQLVLAELTGYVKTYNKKLTEETVTFDA